MPAKSLWLHPECIEKVNHRVMLLFVTQKELAKTIGISVSTLRQFLKGEKISLNNFCDICDYLNIDVKEVGDLSNISSTSVTTKNLLAEADKKPNKKTSAKTKSHVLQPKQDWGEAQEITQFYGRTESLETLKQWILEDQCRLITLLGMGGIGKTALSIKLAQTIEVQFDFVIWRSLREYPPVEEIVTDLINILSRHKETNIPNRLGNKITKLIEYLKLSRCLLVLDNVESILQGGANPGDYREGYEGYGSLLRRVGNSLHQSCLLITSREKPSEIVPLQGINRGVRTLSLKGLEESVEKILQAKEVTGSVTEIDKLRILYSGNPLAVNIVATIIKDLFAGNLTRFLEQNTVIFSDIVKLLDSQFNRLVELDKTIMYWLAINRESYSFQKLLEDIVPKPTSSELMDSLDNLSRRSLIERTKDGYTLQNVVMEYITQKLIAGFRQEIFFLPQTMCGSYFHHYALMKAMAKDYVRETQMRLIVKPVVDGVRNLEVRCKTILEVLREQGGSGYGAGNVLNILSSLNLDLSGFDFSGLNVRQAYLQGKVLHGVNFSGAHIEKCAFTQTFGSIISVAFSPDEKLIAAGDTNGGVRLWRTSDSQTVLIIQEHSSWVRSVTFSPDSKILASGCGDKTVKLWDVSTGQCLHTFDDHTHWVQSVAFSPDGKTLASAGGCLKIKLWDVSTGQCLQTFEGHSNWVESLAFSPDGLTG